MPKVYFSGKNVQPPQGAQVHVKYSYGSFFQSGDKVKQGLADAVGEGRAALDAAISHIQSNATNGLNGNFKRWAARYFLVDNNGPSADELNTIFAVLRLTQAGVNSSDLSVKVFSSSGSTRGYVTSYFGANGAQSHRNAGIWNGGNGTTKQANKGDIHMSLDGIKAKTLLSAKLFIHEATHKYAGTADFGEKGYTDDGTGSFRENGLTKEQALMNADSYGRFAVHFYRGENNMAQW